MSTEPTRPSKAQIEQWFMDLLRAHGVKTERWNNGEVGLLDVPAKWCAVLSDLMTGLVVIAEDGALPKLLPPGKGKVRR
jgi:hypothetical protein